MAAKGTPNGGLDDISTLAYVSGALTFVAYTNTALSLGSTTVAADLNQPTQTAGYAPVVLSGTWTSVGGILTYNHGSTINPGWTALGSWSAPVTGVAIIRGATCRHFMDLASVFNAAAGKRLEIDLNSVIG